METNDSGALDWAKHHDEILDLFVSQGKTLAQVISHMKRKHNFKANERQYKHRFSNLKNVTANEWMWIKQEFQRRDALGKASEAYLLEKRLPVARVTRGIARQGRRRHVTAPTNQLPNPSRGRISVRTPPLAAANMPGANLNSFNTHMDIEVESYEPQVSIQVSPREVLLGQQIEPEHIVQPNEMDIQAAINNFSSFDPSSVSMVWGLDGDGEVNRPTPYQQPTATIVEDLACPGITSSLRSQYSGGRLSPIFPDFNLENFDTRPSLLFMANLPWFWLQTALEQPDFTTLQMHPLLDGGLSSPTGVLVTLPPETRRGALLALLGPMSDHQLAGNVSAVANKLQRSIPERYQGELSHKVAHILDSRSTGPSSLFAIFSFAAYFASNNKLQTTRMDTFLKWAIDQKYTEHLERFLQINTPTIHAFATQILKSAVRVKDVKFLTTLMDLGVKFDSILDQILQIGDMDFMKLALSRVSPTYFDGQRGVDLFHLCVEGKHFDLARMLATKGVNMNRQRASRTPLYSAVDRRDVDAVGFLLGLGADVNKESFLPAGDPEVPLARAVSSKEPDIVAVLLKHNANILCKVGKQDIMQWCSLNCRNIYRLLQEHTGAIDVGFTIGDLVDAANQGDDSFNAYLQRQPRTISKQQLEQGLGESVRLGYIEATKVLLKHGVSPNCPSLGITPLRTAVHSHKHPRGLCELLIEHKADVDGFDNLAAVVRANDFKLLEIFIKAGVDLEEQGMKALAEAARLGHTPLAALLLHSGVDVNTPGLKMNPLQMAAGEGQLKMVEFLLDYGADINAPAYLNDGRTALQSALNGENPEIALLLLDRGADISAPPALVGGLTALEAVCQNWNWVYALEDNCLVVCNSLLDASAPVNRPNGKPSSALHGAIERGWDGILARLLEPQRNAIINHMWCDETIEEDGENIWEPRTPIQLAAEYGQLEAMKMLFGRGADVNEPAAYRFGRTALQAATSRHEPDIDLVQFLLDNGADVNAKPAVHGGITALQGSAISGDIEVAARLIDKGADVNGAPSVVEGRYAIEGAAEHGRLDMVRFLLNAEARGNVLNGTGFKRAIELAAKNEHFAIANLLKNVATAEA